MKFQDFAKAMLIAQILANSSEKSSEKEPTDLNENNVNKENEMNIESNQNTDEFYNPLDGLSTGQLFLLFGVLAFVLAFVLFIFIRKDEMI